MNIRTKHGMALAAALVAVASAQAEMMDRPEGIKIGSTQHDVDTKCKNPTKSSESSYTYTSGKNNLKFNFRDGAVVGIDYMRTTG